jgi:glycosyltransferase A (GT-A) superfamily protein (DUF2064 family)
LIFPLHAAERCGADVHLFSTDITGIAPEVRHRLPVSRLHVQQGGSFANRLSNAAARLAGLGYEKIIILGRDCPQLTATDCRSAIQSLDAHRLVIGPDQRGGCYLIGLHAIDVAMLSQVQWRAGVDAAQLQRLVDGDLLLLPARRDLHGPADLRRILATSRRFRRLFHRRPMTRRTRERVVLPSCSVRSLNRLPRPPPVAA